MIFMKGIMPYVLSKCFMMREIAAMKSAFGQDVTLHSMIKKSKAKYQFGSQRIQRKKNKSKKKK